MKSTSSASDSNIKRKFVNKTIRYGFESEKIKIDYPIFNIKNTEYNLQKIAQFFNSVYKFKYYYYDQKLGIKSKKPYLSLTNLSYINPFLRLIHLRKKIGNLNLIIL